MSAPRRHIVHHRLRRARLPYHRRFLRPSPTPSLIAVPSASHSCKTPLDPLGKHPKFPRVIEHVALAGS